MGKKAAKIISVTSVRRALSEDIQGRSRRYLFSMIVRIVCFILMLIIPSWPARIGLAAFAVVIPAVAVLVANAGREKGPAPTIVHESGQLDATRIDPRRPALGEGEFLR